MKHLICTALCCMALFLAAIPALAGTPIEIHFVNVSPPVSGCVCQPVDIEVKAQDYDVTTSEVGWDDLIFLVYPPGSWTPTAAAWRDEDGWWHQTFRKIFNEPGEYPDVDEYTFRALDLDIFHGENDPDNVDVRTKVIVKDYYSPNPPITCAITSPADGEVVGR
ncbi:MAG TPA: hypothetical protein VFI02_20755, partial [Armatimonadota bacterium]|nr:hypothetical protein [Armatimonadota bacterium]